MSIEDNKRTCLEFIKRLTEGDLEGFAAMLADDVTWWVQGTWPGAGTLTKQQLLESAKGLVSLFTGPIQMEVIGITAEDDRVAIEAVSHGAMANGDTYRNTYHLLYRVRDGKIIAGKEYLDTMEVNRVLSGASQQ